MCTYTAHILFGLCLTVGFLLTVVSFATPGWSQLYLTGNRTASAEDVIDDPQANAFQFGLLGKLCPAPPKEQQQQTTGNGVGDFGKRCEQAFNNQPNWVKMTLIAMLFAILAEIIAGIWSCVVFTALCCKSCLAWPLPICTGAASLALLIALAIYGSHLEDPPGDMPENMEELMQKSTMGYSMWLCIFALVVMVAATVLAVVLVKVSKVSPV